MYLDHRFGFPPHMMQNQMYKPSAMKGRMSAAKNKYSQVYERALQDKIKQQLIQSSSGMTRLTPSSASFSSSISTLELIEFVLREYEQETPITMQPPTSIKSSYSIYEDLKIIYSLSQEKTINFSSFKRLSEEGRVMRSQESIKSRYNDFLKNLNKEDYQNILSYIEAHGLKGFLVFEKNEEGIRLLHQITKNDPKIIGEATVSKKTPIRSPISADRDMNRSPSMFSVSPSKFPYNYPPPPSSYYPPFPPMYQQMYRQSPSRQQSHQQQSYYDQYMYPPFFMNPYMMPPYGYPPMQQQMYGGEEEETEREKSQQVFEVRPTIKKGNVKTRENEEEIEEAISKKRKFNSGIIQVAPVSNKRQEPLKQQQQQLQQQNQNQQQVLKQQQQQQQQQGGEKQSTLKQPKQTTLNLPPRTIQSTLLMPKIQQGIQPFRQMGFESELRPNTTGTKTLTKEVYDLISDDDKISDEDFPQMISYIAEQVKLSKEKLVSFLDQLSGSFKDLGIFLETRQDNMLWTNEEDSILQGISSKEAAEFKLLVKLKGIQSIKKRIVYHSIELPFKIA